MTSNRGRHRDVDRTLAVLIAQADRLLTSFRGPPPFDQLSATHLRLLAVLGRHDRISVTELAARSAFKLARTAKAVERLEQLQLLQRRRRVDGPDQRHTLIALNRRGRGVAAEAVRHAQRERDRLSRALGPAIERKLKGALSRLIQRLVR
jgi:DNA-binding MarR family transcriptional regulator